MSLARLVLVYFFNPDADYFISLRYFRIIPKYLGINELGENGTRDHHLPTLKHNLEARSPLSIDGYHPLLRSSTYAS